MWNKDKDNKWKELTDQLGDSGRRLINGSNLELTLVNPTVADTGLYTCKTKFNVTRVEDQKDIGPVRRWHVCLMNTGPECECVKRVSSFLTSRRTRIFPRKQLTFVYDVTIQDRPNRLGRPEVREKSSRTVKLRRNGKLVPNFSAIRRLVVEVEGPDNRTYEIPFNNLTAILADEPYLLTSLRPFTQYR